ncbi:hypothetical protein Dvina_13365 [Dactylosporangium vinaceum]|uniref:Uncharacterized protein n=1 Tax=Dactylosporangium vinaceum TaxID=53362 RepID=A0ABV5MG74_9ACTN|nr:hypothetical protein [Dactylosporangium vinaceum]UAB98974.1 hypothetical protein Dvina_13365 [Dactylosporangium vinaceum]
MIRSRALLAAATLAVVAAGLCACGKSSDNTNQEMKAPKPSASAAPSGPPTAERRETIFLDATAQHLCSVQSQVYTDPAAMASAYATRPIYTDLTTAQVDEFQQRVISDPAFADRLTQRIQATCGQAK